MTYTLKEKDLMGEDGCDFEATGETKDEVNQKMMDHASTAHADKFAAMTPEQTEMVMKKSDELLSAQEGGEAGSEGGSESTPA